MSKTKINVKLKEDQYSIHLVDNILDPSLIKKYISDRQIMIIYDNNLSIEKVRDFSSMINSYTKFETISMGIVATEDKKSQETLNDIHNRLIEEKFSRDCLLIGMGGVYPVGRITVVWGGMIKRGISEGRVSKQAVNQAASGAETMIAMGRFTYEQQQLCQLFTMLSRPVYGSTIEVTDMAVAINND